MSWGDGADTEYFGIIVELVRVDDSKPAVNFRLVASPNNWSRTSKQSASVEEVSEKRTTYQQFFQQLIDELRDKHHFTNARAGQPQNWYSFASGARGFTYGVNFAQTGELRATVQIDTGDASKNKWAFDKLETNRDEIERTLAERLQWERLDNRRSCRIPAPRRAPSKIPPMTRSGIGSGPSTGSCGSSGCSGHGWWSWRRR